MGNSIGLANAKRIEPASDAAPKPIAANTGDDSAFDQGFDEYSRAAEPLSAPHQEQLHSIVSSEFACCCKCRIFSPRAVSRCFPGPPLSLSTAAVASFQRSLCPHGLSDPSSSCTASGVVRLRRWIRGELQVTPRCLHGWVANAEFRRRR